MVSLLYGINYMCLDPGHSGDGIQTSLTHIWPVTAKVTSSLLLWQQHFPQHGDCQ